MAPFRRKEGLLLPVRILLVDDHDAVRKSMRALLSLHPGWAVCGEAADGLEAVEKAKQLRPDIVLMDISMPRTDGLEATRILLKDDPARAVIIVTQNDEAVARQQAADVGAKGFVNKGMSIEQLSEIQSNASGVGIRGMRERVRQLGGQINIQSDSSGTTVTVSLPAPSVKNTRRGNTLSDQRGKLQVGN